jgi:FtsX-like permease family protein
MAGPIVSLVLARLRRRGSTAAISVAAVAAAAALIAIVAGIGLVASDLTVGRALDGVGPDRPLIRISHFSASSSDFDTTASVADGALGHHLTSFTRPPVRGVLTRELRDLGAPVFELVVGVDQPEPLVALFDGRLPRPCIDGRRCEALLLSEVAPDFDFRVARPAPDLELEIVGRGVIDPAVPFGALDQRGPFGEITIGGGDYQTGRRSPAVLMVNGVAAVARAPAFDVTGRTYVWASPVDVGAMHPWTANPFRDAVDGLTRDLVAADSAFSVESPLGQLSIALSRADAAAARLLLIGSLAVAILLAFAVFLALVVRDDVGAEVARLRTVGAHRHDRIEFLVLEAAVPAVVGGIVGWVAGAVVVAMLSTWSGADAGPILAGTVLAPAPLAAAGVLIAVAVLATVIATAPGLPRAGGLRTIVAVALTAVVILVWQLATTGPLDEARLVGAVTSPTVVLLPPALAFVAALVLATAMPPVLRALSRRLTRAPLPARLSLLSISREPGRPAATLTLLAFSLGAIVFATGWAASLGRGIEDAAAYRSGADLRVIELGTGLSISRSVVPIDRYRALGDDVTAVPVYRDATTSQPGGRVEILALDPLALPTLPGWRSDFSPTPVGELADRLHVDAPRGGWHVAGHRLPADEPRLVVRFRYAGDSTRLDAVVVSDDGDSTRIPLGTIRDGMTAASGDVPDGAIGGTLTTLIFSNDRIVAGSGHQHEVFTARIAFDGLTGLVDDRPIDIEVFTVGTVTIRAPQSTDGVGLPAVVSPDLAQDAGPDALLDLHVGDGTVPIRVVGVADRAPTIVDTRPRFVVLPLDPFLVALASAVPGSGRPNEMWISAPPERLAAVRTTLAHTPFRFAEVKARADLVAERAGDPLSQAIVWALLVAALAGLTLSVGGLVLGAVTDLRDERGELADLEAQGVPPSSLRWHALARTAWLAIGGSLAGLVAGVFLAVFATGGLALDSEGLLPTPPLIVVLPMLPIAGMVVGVVLVVLGTVALLARRTYGRATLGERRGPPRSAPATGWRGGPEHVDG